MCSFSETSPKPECAADRRAFSFNSNLISPKSVLSDSPIGHWLGGGLAGNERRIVPTLSVGEFDSNLEVAPNTMVLDIDFEGRRTFAASGESLLRLEEVCAIG